MGKHQRLRLTYSTLLMASTFVACSASEEPPPRTRANVERIEATRCAMPPDVEGVRFADASMTSTRGRTHLYLEIQKDFEAIQIRRYRLASEAPCVFERDDSFAAVSLPDYVALAADETGRVYAATDQKVVRVDDAASTERGANCYISSSRPERPIDFSITADGTYGVLVFPGYLATLNVDPGRTRCVIGAFAPGIRLDSLTAVVLDDERRAHVANDASVLVFDLQGHQVKSYPSPMSDVRSIRSMTRCRSGICIDAGSATVAVNGDGNVVRAAYYHESYTNDGLASLGESRLAGAPEAPFVVNVSNGDGPRGRVVAVYAFVGL